MRKIFRAGWMLLSTCNAAAGRRSITAGLHLRSRAGSAQLPEPVIYPDFTGVNNAERMRVGIEMAVETVTPPILTGLIRMLPDRLPIFVVRLFLCRGAPLPSPKTLACGRVCSFGDAEMKSGHKVVMVGTAADRAVADAVMKKSTGSVDLVGRTGIGGSPPVPACRRGCRQRRRTDIPCGKHRCANADADGGGDGPVHVGTCRQACRLASRGRGVEIGVDDVLTGLDRLRSG